MADTLQKEVWVAGIKENPIPDHSFVMASTDMSEFVNNNTIHLAEAGIEPDVHENYFEGSETELPLATIEDIPSEVVLNTYSTERTRHRNLQDVELQYNKRQSIIQRHKNSLDKNLGKRASHAWSPTVNNDFNKILKGDWAKDSFIDAVIDMIAFYDDLDKSLNLNVCLTPQHMALIRKEDVKLYKAIKSEKGMDLYGANIFGYSQNPIYTSDEVKKPMGAVLDTAAGDTRSSFFWVTDEAFRCFGGTEMYHTPASAALQADEISFAQRALLGKIRAKSEKYFGAII